MPYYNKNGHASLFNSAEVRELIIDYEDFIHKRTAFKKDPEFYAHMLLEKIGVIRAIPSDFRYSLPEFCQVRDKDLDELEKRCNEAQSQSSQRTKQRSVDDPREFPPSFVISPPSSK